MKKRTISWLLCLMMVVGLFAGTLTSANAASAGVTVSPASDVIYKTGTVNFTASTILDTLIDKVASDKDFDLNDFVGSLKAEGLDLDTLTGMLSGAGFNWDDIIGSLTENGFSMNDIAGSLLDRLEAGDIHVEDIIGDLSGDTSTLSGLLDALKGQGFSPDVVNSVLDLIKSNSGGGISDLIGDLIGRFGKNGDSASPLAASEEPEDESVVTVIAANLKESLKEKYGANFTEEKEKEFDDLFASITDASGNIPISDAVNALVKNEDFSLNDTVDVIMDATNGKADYNELVAGLKESTGSDLSMDAVAAAFSNSLGDNIDWGNLADALENNLSGSFDVNDFLAAIGSSDTDLSGIAASVSDALGMEEGAIDAEAVKNALNEALKGGNGFDADAFAAAMGEGFDSDAFLQSVADQLSEAEGPIDAEAVSSAIESALSEQNGAVDPGALAKALKDAMGENFSVETLTAALTDALKGEDGEAPALDDVVSGVTDAMGGELTKEQVTDLVKGLSDSLGDQLDLSELVTSLTDTLNGDLSTGELLDALKAALGENFDLNVDEIAGQLLGEGTDLGELVTALKERGFTTGEITDLLFDGELTYRWWSRSGKSSDLITSSLDSNVYSGEKTRTLTVTRNTAPTQDEVYHYFCKITIGDKDAEYDSPDAELTIKATDKPSTPTDEPTTEPTTPPTMPVLDNVTHAAFIGGYEDGTVRPNSKISRAEVATIIYRLLTESSRSFYYTSVNAFTDVPSFEWFNEQISTLARASVLTGYEDNTFRPNNNISRAELATILTRLTVLVPTESAGTAKNFYDTIGHWAAASIRTAAANGWITGYEDGSFRPDQEVTRAEAVTMVNRMLGRNPEVLTNTAGMRTFSDNMDPAEWYYIQIQEAANGHDYTRGADGHELWMRVVNKNP